MFKKRDCIAILLTIPFISFAQESTDSVQITKTLEEVSVNALRAGAKIKWNTAATELVQKNTKSV